MVPSNIMTRTVLRLLLMFGLVVAVLLEGYYIFELRYRMGNREEELKTISMQLQSLRNERDALQEELSSMKKSGENKDGTTAEGQH